MQDGQFLVNHYWIPGSVVVFPNRYFMWNVLEADEIKPHTLELMNFVKPRPDYLIIGTGELNINLDETFYQHFKRMGIAVDTCPSVSALSVIIVLLSLRPAVLSICALRTITTWPAHYSNPTSAVVRILVASRHRTPLTLWSPKKAPTIT